MANKEPDKLAQASTEAWEKGISYGKLMAMRYEQEQAKQMPIPRKIEVPEGWLVCQWCGKPFKPKTKKKQKFCEPMCQYEYEKKKYKELRASYKKEWTAKRKEGIKD